MFSATLWTLRVPSSSCSARPDARGDASWAVACARRDGVVWCAQSSYTEGPSRSVADLVISSEPRERDDVSRADAAVATVSSGVASVYAT